MNVNEVIKHLQTLAKAGYGEKPFCFDTEACNFHFHVAEIDYIVSAEDLKEMENVLSDKYPVFCLFDSKCYSHDKLLAYANEKELLDALKEIKKLKAEYGCRKFKKALKLIRKQKRRKTFYE